ncbi:MAG: DNA gyrase subunit A, partial [Spirochaetia bacterium]|nr:DNA gyrase subunit A [Spirochaetia bacterium]
LNDYTDFSTDVFKIQLDFKRGFSPTDANLKQVFARVNNESLCYNVITSEGSLEYHGPEDIIARFCKFRKKHLVRRFKRLSLLEQEKISQNSELIRFIQEEWNRKVTKIKSKSEFEKQLKENKFKHFEWLAGLPVYRMTLEEVRKCQEAIVEAKKNLKYFQTLVKHDKDLTSFMIDEVTELARKWDS